MVLSPAVGVFQPETARRAARVRAGDRIAIVDLLGIAQDVIAPIDGTLVEVFAQAGEAVEYGEEVAAVDGGRDGRDRRRAGRRRTTEARRPSAAVPGRGTDADGEASA